MSSHHRHQAVKAHADFIDSAQSLVNVESIDLYQGDQLMARMISDAFDAVESSQKPGNDGYVPTAIVDRACSAFEGQLRILNALQWRELETLESIVDALAESEEGS